MISRAPCPALRPFVSTVWASDGREGRGARERVLPTGSMHLVLRSSEPLRLYAREDDPEGTIVGHAIVGGARASAYLRDVSRPVVSVGAQLRPGASAVLLGVPGAALAERHTDLCDVWGAEAERMRERLAEVASPSARLELFEAMLVARLDGHRATGRDASKVVALALARLDAGASIGAIVSESGYSHRGFTALFQREVGLSPKLFSRVLRLRRALAAAARGTPWARVAIEHGFADQPHLHRELRALAGITPAAYLRASPRDPGHVPVELPIPSRPRGALAPRSPEQPEERQR